MLSVVERIAAELEIAKGQVQAAVALLDGGATVPFIARYRKDATGSMDDNQLRVLEERLSYIRELDDRRETILKSIVEQGKLTDELNIALRSAKTKTRLEDLYLPYKPKRRNKAQIAIEAGLEPLADSLLNNPELEPQVEAQAYIGTEGGVPDARAALDGARSILMERFSENAELLEKLRIEVREHGRLCVSLASEDKRQEGEKFADYFDYSERLNRIPSHRMLAVLRGRNEDVLRASIKVGEDESENLPTAKSVHPCEGIVQQHFNYKHLGRLGDDWLKNVFVWTWSVKLGSQIESDIMLEKRHQAEEAAIDVFANNLKDLLLAAPAGPRTTLGLDPGYRSGVKVAVVDASSRVLDHQTIYPHAPQKHWNQAITAVATLCDKYDVDLISIGNGTASRETEKMVIELLEKFPSLKLKKIVVSEAGASVYSASEFASREFPELDVTIRGAISIARRLQDPLAELVKIEPRAIGVGQYQHDVNQYRLARTLDSVVEDCVNSVGVDLNTASEPLLARVSGLNQSVATNIVEFRQTNGEFKSRKELLKVARLGPKMFEQSAGFLRIMNGDHPLDASCVHPESYPVVEKIAKNHQREIHTLIGDQAFLRKVDATQYATQELGTLTLKDILHELEKPGRDPRPEFRTAEFQDGIEKISDLNPNMLLEGVVTNVTNFGAFVDVGVHQDGLVHISALSNNYVKDPREIVKAGDIVKVKVMEVDVQRKRIGLSMRLADSAIDPDDVSARKTTAKKTVAKKPDGSRFAPETIRSRQKSKRDTAGGRIKKSNEIALTMGGVGNFRC
ncbi:MAG: S1 RNA-binding domain-containing protein [Gammaproteobacteria bacterium]|nr:S1 RNA-binding domain-containing protein [Gammaproteobacteria bacterium]